MSLRLDRHYFVWTSLLAGLLLVFTVAGWWLWQKHQWAQAQLDTLTPRHARLDGLLQSRQAWDEVNAYAQQSLVKLLYPADQEGSQVANDAQQRIRTLFADSQLDIVSIQALPAKTQGTVDKIGIVLRVEGELSGLINALTALENQSPQVWVEGVSVQTIGLVKPKSAQKLSGQLTFFVLQDRKP